VGSADTAGIVDVVGSADTADIEGTEDIVDFLAHG